MNEYMDKPIIEISDITALMWQFYACVGTAAIVLVSYFAWGV